MILQIILVYTASFWLLSIGAEHPNQKYVKGDPCIECGQDYEFYPNTYQLNK